MGQVKILRLRRSVSVSAYISFLKYFGNTCHLVCPCENYSSPLGIRTLKKMQRTSKIALNSGFIPAEACGWQDDVILLCLALSTLRRRNLLVALAQYTVCLLYTSDAADE